MAHSQECSRVGRRKDRLRLVCPGLVSGVVSSARSPLQAADFLGEWVSSSAVQAESKLGESEAGLAAEIESTGKGSKRRPEAGWWTVTESLEFGSDYLSAWISLCPGSLRHPSSSCRILLTCDRPLGYSQFLHSQHRLPSELEPKRCRAGTWIWIL